MRSGVRVQKLGQAGFRFQFGGRSLFIDPYLSDRVERNEGARFRRMVPAPLRPEEINDAAYVLVSHIHTDHCDADTLIPISRASPGCRFIGPRDVTTYLAREGIAAERLITANRLAIDLGKGLRIVPVPAAHKVVEEDFDGYLRFLGYVICWAGKRFLHTGDTCVHAGLMDAVRAQGAIDVAFLPVNECNYFRDKAGIVGNMSIREAFALGEALSAATVVPMHFDMFEPNQTYPEEIEVVYRRMRPAFRLDFDPENI